MKKNIAAIALCATQSLAANPVFADVIPPSRPATAEEMQVCEKFSDYSVLSIQGENSGNLIFSVLTCALATVRPYDCAELFRLATISHVVRGNQGGALNTEQRLHEDQRYARLGVVYENTCNLSS